MQWIGELCMSVIKIINTKWKGKWNLNKKKGTLSEQRFFSSAVIDISSIKDVEKCLKKVLKSVQRHNRQGTRGYLDFIIDFV